MPVLGLSWDGFLGLACCAGAAAGAAGGAGAETEDAIALQRELISEELRIGDRGGDRRSQLIERSRALWQRRGLCG